ncbi:MAG: hypothetical protein WCB19_03215 [Thermoplasmata archaeon]
MVAAPRHSARRRRQIWVGLAAVAAFVVAAIEIGLLVLTPGAASVVVSNVSFQYFTPPTNWCPFVFTTGEPPPVLEVPTGPVFNLSWGIGCEPYGPGNTTGATFVISSVVSSSWGYKVVASDVPVVFGYDRDGYLNVSVRAPDWPAYGSLMLTVGGGPYPAD